MPSSSSARAAAEWLPLTPIEAEVYVATRFPGRDVYMNALLGLLRTGEYAASTTSVVKE